MAYADYRLCDVCDGKAFYDSDLNYDFKAKDLDGMPKLGYVATMKVICDDCAVTHEVIIRERVK